MNGGGKVSHSVSGVFVFLLLGIFAVFSTVTVVLGARAYKATSEVTVSHNGSRIASAYLRSMVRTGDVEGTVVMEEIDGIQTVSLCEAYDGEEFRTRLYVYDGMLRELFTAAELPFEPENGETVCAADEMTAGIRDGLLSIRIRNGGTWTEVELALRAAAQ